MIQPIGSLILGAIILGESPSPLQLLGALLVLATVIAATRTRGTATATETDPALPDVPAQLLPDRRAP
jgi:drug/metabolite transporter (DMT)-like permease